MFRFIFNPSFFKHAPTQDNVIVGDILRDVDLFMCGGQKVAKAKS